MTDASGAPTGAAAEPPDTDPPDTDPPDTGATAPDPGQRATATTGLTADAAQLTSESAGDDTPLRPPGAIGYGLPRGLIIVLGLAAGVIVAAGMHACRTSSDRSSWRSCW